MPYIRLDTKALRGSLHFNFTREERCIWYELLMLSKELHCPGYLQQSEDRGYPLSYIAGQLGLSSTQLKNALDKYLEYNMITANSKGCIKINNWLKYQPSYDYKEQSTQSIKCNAQWDAMSDKEKALAIEAFGPVESWDEMNWIAATGKLADEDAERINQGIIKEGGNPLPF